MKGLIQPKDYGDVIALLGLANYHNITHWPVCEHVLELFEHLPNITPIVLSNCNDLSQHYYQESYDALLDAGVTDFIDVLWIGRKTPWEKERTRIGLKHWRDKIRTKYFVDEMKYVMGGTNFSVKYTHFNWVRFEERENALYDLLGCNDDYIVVHDNPGSAVKGAKIDNIELKTDRKIIHVKKIKGYTIFDWFKVFENAKEVHMIDSAPANFVECARIDTDKFLHLYARRNTSHQPEKKWGFSFKDDWTKYYKKEDIND